MKNLIFALLFILSTQENIAQITIRKEEPNVNWVVESKQISRPGIPTSFNIKTEVLNSTETLGSSKTIRKIILKYSIIKGTITSMVITLPGVEPPYHTQTQIIKYTKPDYLELTSPAYEKGLKNGYIIEYYFNNIKVWEATVKPKRILK